ncbi:MAG: radical SAM protein [Candidatus Omnitrophica bacterium]|nr:radical SAM protein [Candidatus Omnitrophota bacterium]
MRVLLVRPYWPYPYSRGEDTYNRIWPPLSLANCAALLERQGYNVKIMDASLERIRPHRIEDYIKGYDKVFITSSSLDRWQCPNIDISTFLETVRSARKLTNEVYVIGYHGTVNPEDILNRSGARAVVRGEPEYAVVEICNNNDLHGIKGISFRDNGRFISNPESQPIDLKNLPVPAYHLLDIKRYSYELLGRSFLLFEISRGCEYSCRFCNKIMYGEGLRTKTEAQIIEEVKTAIEKYNIKTGYFIDLNFLSNREIAEELCAYLIKNKYRFQWTCQTRPDLLDIEILEKMKEAGCQLIHIGIETGSQKSLKYLNKDIAIDEIKKSIKLCKKVGLKTLGFFLFGLPGETDEDRKNVFEFIKELNTDFVSFHKIIPYKRTKDYQDNVKLNGDVDRFINKAMCKYYLRPSYLYKLDICTLLSGFRLFWGRIASLR